MKTIKQSRFQLPRYTGEVYPLATHLYQNGALLSVSAKYVKAFEMAKHSVIISYGPYESCYIVKYTEDRLDGLKCK